MFKQEIEATVVKPESGVGRESKRPWHKALLMINGEPVKLWSKVDLMPYKGQEVQLILSVGARDLVPDVRVEEVVE